MARLVAHSLVLLLLALILILRRSIEVCEFRPTSAVLPRRTDILYQQCPKVRLIASGFGYTYHQDDCPGYGDTLIDPDSDFSPHVPTKEPNVPTVVEVIVPSDLTSTYGEKTHPSNPIMITRANDQLRVRAASPDNTQSPWLPPLQNGHFAAEPVSRIDNEEVKNTFKILIIVLLIVAVIAIVMIRIVKQNRKKKKAAARAAGMEMAIRGAIQQQASQSNYTSDEQLPSYTEAIAAGAHRVKSGDISRSAVVANNEEYRRAMTEPDPADLGNGVRPGGISQPVNSRMAQAEEGTVSRPIVID